MAGRDETACVGKLVAVQADPLPDCIRDIDPCRALAQSLRQFEAFAVIKIQNQASLPGERLPYGTGVDLVAGCHVAADTRGKTQERGHLDFGRLFSVDFLERVLDRFVKRGNYPVDHVRHVKENVLELVEHGHLLRRVFIGLPDGGDIGPDAFEAGSRFLWCQRRVLHFDHAPHDVLLLAQNGSPGGLGGMGGEDRLEPDVGDQLLRGSCIDARVTDPAERLGKASRLHRGLVLQVVAASPDPVNEFGGVDDLEVGRKGADEVPGLRCIQ